MCDDQTDFAATFGIIEHLVEHLGQCHVGLAAVDAADRDADVIRSCMNGFVLGSERGVVEPPRFAFGAQVMVESGG